jgi:hypothetical protein
MSTVWSAVSATTSWLTHIDRPVGRPSATGIAATGPLPWKASVDTQGPDCTSGCAVATGRTTGGVGTIAICRMKPRELPSGWAWASATKTRPNPSTAIHDAGLPWSNRQTRRK